MNKYMKFFQQIIRRVAILLFAAMVTISMVNASESTESYELPLQDVRVLVEVFDQIKKAYVEEVTDRKLLESAIQGMLHGLDPHSSYLGPEAYQDLQINTSGEFGGLGIEVGMENGFVKVIAPIDDTPAQQAGIKAGDLIIKLDDESIKGMSLSEAVKHMRGKPNTKIVLTIIRDNEPKPLEITVIRAIIQVKSVKSRILEPGFGYIRLTQFQLHTAQDLRKAIAKLRDESAEKLKGMVLDLRNNPGGILQEAVEVTDMFLEEGLIVYTQGRLPNSELRFNATAGDVLKNIPIVVLINGGSASASEIVAGALRDHGRAVIMGTTSFGKGSVQTVLPLQEKRALKLTTARYYTPKGHSIQAQGIEPDILVDAAMITPLASGLDYRESNLRGHLSNHSKSDKKQDKDKANQKNGLESIETDYQLFEALSLLKGLSVLQASVN